MALSKDYTLNIASSLIRDLADVVLEKEIQPDTIKAIINKNTLDIATELNGAAVPDYGTVATVSDAASSVLSSYVTGASYTSGSKSISDTAHGLTSTSVGKRIVYWISSSKVCVTWIVSITDVDNFTVYHDLAATGTINYAVFSSHSAANIDVSALRIDKVIKLVDSIGGLVSESKDFDFENLAAMDNRVEDLEYYLWGETLFLFKGANVTAWGTLTLYYYRFPVPVAENTDYIDMKDKYIPLLIDKCKMEVYEKSKMLPPKELQQSVESKMGLIVKADAGKNATIQARK